MGAVEDRNSKTNVAGGASAKPTPANNVTGGSDSGSASGSGDQTGQNVQTNSDYQGPGHTAIPNPLASEGGFLGLQGQKGAAQAHTARRVADAGGVLDERVKDGSLDETCATEDHSFMQHKPGGSATLPGSSIIKGAMDR